MTSSRSTTRATARRDNTSAVFATRLQGLKPLAVTNPPAECLRLKPAGSVSFCGLPLVSGGLPLVSGALPLVSGALPLFVSGGLVPARSLQLRRAVPWLSGAAPQQRARFARLQGRYMRCYLIHA